ncbi:hypothetical protein ACGFSG_23425 [Streptomyces sp. NPDC048512]|uniref:hypothetical protein n=1 Tax=unclassified Streptomyces TaxID=2593676 RepID=UPI0009BC8BFD|nr:hypothetical protein [Streptomyces sp. M41(2017)]OQQ17032.1 hypothetical protein B0675_07680 [Streptomyces sp. M41(2017)]
MDWLAPVSAVIGGGIAVASGWTVERSRWKREDARQERDRRTALYADYLAAVLSAREQIWHASRWRELPRAERIALARNSLRDSQVYPMRDRILLVGSPRLGELSYEIVRRLTAYRDAVIEELDDSNAELHAAWDSINEARDALTVAMRTDLDSLRI